MLLFGIWWLLFGYLAMERHTDDVGETKLWMALFFFMSGFVGFVVAISINPYPWMPNLNPVVRRKKK